MAANEPLLTGYVKMPRKGAFGMWRKETFFAIVKGSELTLFPKFAVDKAHPEPLERVVLPGWDLSKYDKKLTLVVSKHSALILVFASIAELHRWHKVLREITSKPCPEAEKSKAKKKKPKSRSSIALSQEEANTLSLEMTKDPEEWAINKPMTENPLWFKHQFQIVKEGPVNKRGRYRKWNSRYFVIRGCCCYYYRQEQDAWDPMKDWLGMIDLTNALITEAQVKKPHCFSIFHPDRREYILEAPSQEEMVEWIEACTMAKKIPLPSMMDTLASMRPTDNNPKEQQRIEEKQEIQSRTAEAAFTDITDQTFANGTVLFFQDGCPLGMQIASLDRLETNVQYLTSARYTRVMRISEEIVRINGLMFRLEKFCVADEEPVPATAGPSAPAWATTNGGQVRCPQSKPSGASDLSISSLGSAAGMQTLVNETHTIEEEDNPSPHPVRAPPSAATEFGPAAIESFHPAEARHVNIRARHSADYVPSDATGARASTAFVPAEIESFRPAEAQKICVESVKAKPN